MFLGRVQSKPWILEALLTMNRKKVLFDGEARGPKQPEVSRVNLKMCMQVSEVRRYSEAQQAVPDGPIVGTDKMQTGGGIWLASVGLRLRLASNEQSLGCSENLCTQGTKPQAVQRWWTCGMASEAGTEERLHNFRISFAWLSSPRDILLSFSNGTGLVQAKGASPQTGISRLTGTEKIKNDPRRKGRPAGRDWPLIGSGFRDRKPELPLSSHQRQTPLAAGHGAHRQAAPRAYRTDTGQGAAHTRLPGEWVRARVVLGKVGNLTCRVKRGCSKKGGPQRFENKNVTWKSDQKIGEKSSREGGEEEGPKNRWNTGGAEGESAAKRRLDTFFLIFALFPNRADIVGQT